MAWSDRLARKLVLSDGRQMATLQDAANLFVGPFDGLTHTQALHAIELLMRAADSGGIQDIEDATDQVARVLAIWNLTAEP